MADLVCSLGTGKGTWLEVSNLAKIYDWKNIFIITNDFGKENFNCGKPVTFIIIDWNKDYYSIKEIIIKELKDKVSGDVALNFSSGTGKEHMAILSSMLSIGVGLRFIVPENNQIKEI